MNDEQGENRDRSSFIVHRSSFEVVVATPDVVGERMAGPGIRATYFARELAKIPNVNVTLVSRDVIPNVITEQYAADGSMTIPSPGLRPPSPGGRGISAEGGLAPHGLSPGGRGVSAEGGLAPHGLSPGGRGVSAEGGLAPHGLSPGGKGVSAEGGLAPHRLVESLLPPGESARSADEGPVIRSYARN